MYTSQLQDFEVMLSILVKQKNLEQFNDVYEKVVSINKQFKEEQKWF